MFQANPQRTGVYNTAGVQHLRGIKWRFPRGSFSGIPSSPEVANGVVYFSSIDGYLYALDAETGRQLWTFETTAGSLFDLTFSNGVVYGNEPEGYICAINIQTRQQKWRSQLGTLRNSNPAIADSVVYVGNDDGHLYALDEETGQLLWSFKTTKNMATTSPAIANGVVYIGSSDGRLYAVDAETGQQKWQSEIGPLGVFPMDSFPTIVDDALLCITTRNSTLQVLAIETGQEVWHFQIADVNSFTSPPVIANGVAYFIERSLSQLYAIDIRTGQELWKQGSDQTGYRYWRASGSAVADGTIYVGCEGAVYALDLQAGQELWRFIPPDPTLRAEGPIWFTLISWLMEQFKMMTTGTPLARFSPPIVASGVVYVSCSNGYLYALH